VCAQFQLSHEQQAEVDQTLQQMTLDEKIGQVMFAVTAGAFTNQESDESQKVKENIQKCHVGGYHLEGYSGCDPASGASLVTRMQQLAAAPLLITAAFEGGVGYQLPGALRYFS
jgi:beta-N-acetylhexosaminidase